MKDAGCRIVQVEQNRERMLSSPRHPIRWPGLKSLPVLIVAALADAINRIKFQITIIGGLRQKFSGCMIKHANSPDRSLLRKGRNADHSEHEPRFAHSKKSHRI